MTYHVSLEALEKAAQAWCAPTTEKITMDPRLAIEFAHILMQERVWRDTVDDMLSVCHDVASDNPRESINKLINFHCQVALDPSVSSDAQALVDKTRKEVWESLAEQDWKNYPMQNWMNGTYLYTDADITKERRRNIENFWRKAYES